MIVHLRAALLKASCLASSCSSTWPDIMIKPNQSHVQLDDSFPIFSVIWRSQQKEAGRAEAALLMRKQI